MEEKRDFYHIRVEGHLDPCWSEWLDGLTLTHYENGETLLSGFVEDQAALHGLLNKIRDMNLPLIAVERGHRPCAPQSPKIT